MPRSRDSPVLGSVFGLFNLFGHFPAEKGAAEIGAPKKVEHLHRVNCYLCSFMLHGVCRTQRFLLVRVTLREKSVLRFASALGREQLVAEGASAEAVAAWQRQPPGSLD